MAVSNNGARNGSRCAVGLPTTRSRIDAPLGLVSIVMVTLSLISIGWDSREPGCQGCLAKTGRGTPPTTRNLIDGGDRACHQEARGGRDLGFPASRFQRRS